jgi:hypothetical protein
MEFVCARPQRHDRRIGIEQHRLDRIHQGLWQVRGTVTLVGDVELDLAAGVVALDDEVPHQNPRAVLF